MKWQTKNYLGEVVTWYSEDVIEKIREICKDAIDGCNCKDANPDIDCFDCRSGGEAEIGNKILQIIEK